MLDWFAAGGSQVRAPLLPPPSDYAAGVSRQPQKQMLSHCHEFGTCALGEKCSALPPLIVLGLELATAS